MFRSTCLIVPCLAFTVSLPLSAQTSKSADAKPVILTLQVPADSIVELQGTKVEGKGETRQFQSPPLPPGEYIYQIKVTWTANGKLLFVERMVRVRAGQEIEVDLRPQPSGASPSAPKPLPPLRTELLGAPAEPVAEDEEPVNESGKMAMPSAPPAPGDVGSKPVDPFADVKSEVAETRREAVAQLGNFAMMQDPITGRAAVTAMAPLAKDKDAKVREAVIGTLGSFRRMAKPALPALIEALANPEMRVRFFAAQSLANLGAHAKEAIPALQGRLADKHAGVRAEVAAALVAVDPNDENKQLAAATLTPLVADEKQKRWVRLRAAEALSKIDPKPIQPHTAFLVAALAEEKLNVKLPAAAILARTDPSHAEQAVKILIEASKSQLIEATQSAYRYLNELGAAALPAFQTLLKDPDVAVKQQALGMISHMGPAGLPTLIEALKDPNPNISGFAATLVANLGDAAKPAVPQLLVLARGPVVEKPVAQSSLQQGEPQHDPQMNAFVALLRIDRASAMPEAKRLLAHPAPFVRGNVLHTLTWLAPDAPETRAAVLAGMKDKEQRPHMIHSLRMLNPDKEFVPLVVELLTEQVQAGDANGLTFTCPVLTSMGPDARAAVPVLLEAMRKPALRSRAAEALAEIDPAQAKQASAAVAEGLTAEDPAARFHAAKTLLRIDPAQSEKALPILLQALNEPLQPGAGQFGGDAVDPVTAATMLAEVGPAAKQAAPILVRILKDPNTFSFSRIGVARSLAKVDPSQKGEAVDVLRTYVFESDNPFLRADSAALLVELEPSTAKDVVAVLTESIKNREVEGMGMGAKLASRLIHGLAGVTLTARDAAMPALEALTKDPDPAVRSSAENAVRQVASGKLQRLAHIGY